MENLLEGGAVGRVVASHDVMLPVGTYVPSVAIGFTCRFSVGFIDEADKVALWPFDILIHNARSSDTLQSFVRFCLFCKVNGRKWGYQGALHAHCADIYLLIKFFFMS